LKDGLNMVNFQQCQTILQACDRDLYLKPVCLEQKLYRYPECVQLSALAKLASVSADLISAKSEGNLALITFRDPIQAQVAYAVLSQGKLIDVSVDPEKVMPSLKEQYPNGMFFSRVIAEPLYKVSASGDRQFIASIRIAKDCDVCDTLGNVKLILHFEPNGKYVSRQIESN